MAGADAQARPRFAGLRFLAVLAVLLATPAPTGAGAWIAPEDGQLIATEVIGERDGETFLESQIYLERPLAQRFAFVLRPWLELAQGPGGETYSRNETTVGLKAVAIRTNEHVLALQAAALWRSTPDPVCAESGGELRALAGTFDASSNAFVNAEAAFQSLGDCARTKLDLTFGFRPNDRWLGLVEGFADAADDGAGDIKAQFSVVRFLRNGVGLQFGVRARLGEEDAEPALVLALWRDARR